MSEYYVHPTSVVDDGVIIGDGTKIWHFCHIQTGARIGNKCSFGQNVNVSNNVTVGNGVKVQNNVSLYESDPKENWQFGAILRDHHGADNCIGCGACEAACPQHLSIIDGLQQAWQDLGQK